jgi:hypothetical protein
MLPSLDPSSFTRTPPPLRVWLYVAVAVLAVMGTLEVALRAGLIWHLPLRMVLKEGSDVNTRAAWRIFNTRPDPREVIVLGSSMADAVVEPKGVVRQDTFDAILGPGETRVVNLSVNRSCAPEQTVVLDNALENGHRPSRVVIFTWPGCFTREDADERSETLLAVAFPLTSDYLDARTPPDSFDERIERWLTRHVALVRFRPFGNAWLRQRAKMALRGRPFVRRFRPDDRTATWEGPWTADTTRREQLAALRSRLTASGIDTRPLATLLQFARAHGLRAVLVEVPWSPPIREYFADLAPEYRRAVASVAGQYGVPYLDLNPESHLESAHFHDSYHVNTKGADRYLRALLRRLEATD